MNRKELRKRARADAINESKLDDEREAKAERKLRRWNLATAIIGGALLLAIIAVVPFLAGQPLHNWWETIGKRILLVAMGLYGVFVYTVAHTIIFWYYLRGMRKIHKKYAPPGSKYRTGKGGRSRGCNSRSL